MIASQKIGKSFMGALDYNLKKLYDKDPDKRAELLDTNFTSLDLSQIKAEVDWIKQLRPNLNKYVYHTSLNFHEDDQRKLSNEKLLAIAHDYLELSGYTNNQYMIFRHYDARHPHIHLLVNRISFDGTVVSDSNNYKKSEALIRNLERKYGLKSVAGSKQSLNRAAKKDEVEMVIRTGKPSGKMVLQEKLKRILTTDTPISLQDFISRAENAGIGLLFNQASTGRVTGITYYYGDFKSTGKALGNQFKWLSIIKQVNYEQNRDGQMVSAANRATATKYGTRTEQTGISGTGAGDNAIHAGSITPDAAEYPGKQKTYGGDPEITTTPGGKDPANPERTLETDQAADRVDHRTAGHLFAEFMSAGISEISDDIDDEAIYGKDRHRKRKARTNTR
jgi:Relaxase/Mobilisation nuclease domain